MRCCSLSCTVHAGGGVRAFRAVSLLSGRCRRDCLRGVLAAHAIVIVRRIATVHPLIFCCVLIAIAIPVLRGVTVVHVVLRSFTSLRFVASGRILFSFDFTERFSTPLVDFSPLVVRLPSSARAPLYSG